MRMRRLKERSLALFLILLSHLFASSLVPAFAVFTLPTPTCGADSCTITLTSTSDYYLWTVPSGISSVQVVATGGGGGTGFYSTERAPGGVGAKLTETITVTVGDQLYFYVGGAGGNGGSNVAGSAGTNAAGSSGSPGAASTGYGGGGGGAASEIRRNGTGVANRIVVAAGGGGGGGGCGGSDAATQANDAGGNASGNTGGAGLCTGYSSSNRGMGGTISADGNGGISRVGRTSTMTGGGGGGGYFGGGAGIMGGGGAGSSWIDATYVTGSFASAPTVSAGAITFTYTYIPPTFTGLTINNGTTPVFRTVSPLVATVSTDGFVTFLANNKRIAGCIKAPTTSLSVTCNFKPNIHASIQITVMLYAARSDASPVATLIKNSSSSSRTNKR